MCLGFRDEEVVVSERSGPLGIEASDGRCRKAVPPENDAVSTGTKAPSREPLKWAVQDLNL